MGISIARHGMAMGGHEKVAGHVMPQHQRPQGAQHHATNPRSATESCFLRSPFGGQYDWHGRRTTMRKHWLLPTTSAHQVMTRLMLRTVGDGGQGKARQGKEPAWQEVL